MNSLQEHKKKILTVTFNAEALELLKKHKLKYGTPNSWLVNNLLLGYLKQFESILDA